MQGGYVEDNNKTGYPLHGGVNTSSPSGNPVVQEYSEKMHDMHSELTMLKTENLMLKEHNKQLLDLLRLALGKNDKDTNGNA